MLGPNALPSNPSSLQVDALLVGRDLLSYGTNGYWSPGQGGRRDLCQGGITSLGTEGDGHVALCISTRGLRL